MAVHEHCPACGACLDRPMHRCPEANPMRGDIQEVFESLTRYLPAVPASARVHIRDQRHSVPKAFVKSRYGGDGR